MRVCIFILMTIALIVNSAYPSYRFHGVDYFNDRLRARQSNSDIAKLRHKWGILFDALDYNRDGTLRRSDMDTALSKVINDIPVNERTDFIMDLGAWWLDYLMTNSLDVELTKDQFQQRFEDAYRADETAFKEHITRAVSFVYTNFIDLNKDGQLSKDEVDEDAKFLGLNSRNIDKLVPISVADMIALIVNLNIEPNETAQDNLLEKAIEEDKEGR